MWLVILSLVGIACGVKLTAPVNTPSGQIRGILAEDGTYSSFFGVPFAQVNASNPFGISTPHPGFESTFDAINETIIMCPQLPPRANSSVDCLNLNIYVPNNAGSKIPVLVWIYGGAFKNGYTRLYDEQFLVRHKVIFVSLNYRVGPYGFMCLDTEEVPGNQGLKDQYLAFKWISENIGAFGGDPSRITVMGGSSGAVTIELHLLSDLPIFFDRAILQSGTAHLSQSIVPSNKMVPIRMAKHLGFATDSITEALSFLATTSMENVIAAYTELNILHRPCVEKKFLNVERFLSSHPDHENIPLRNVSILAGFNDQEGLMLKNALEKNNIEVDELMPNVIFEEHMNQQFDTTLMSDMVDKVRRFYIGDENFKQKEGEFVDFLSDFFYVYPLQRSLIRYSEAGATVYQYLFSYDGGRNYIKYRSNIKKKGASHGDELGYLFNMDGLKQPTFTDQVIIDRMTTMWTNFAKYGNPTPTTSELLPVIWPQVTKDVVWCLNIDTNLTVVTRPFRKRLLFWDLFYVANQDKLWAKVGRTSTDLQDALSILFFNP